MSSRVIYTVNMRRNSNDQLEYESTLIDNLRPADGQYSKTTCCRRSTLSTTLGGTRSGRASEDFGRHPSAQRAPRHSRHCPWPQRTRPTKSQSLAPRLLDKLGEPLTLPVTSKSARVTVSKQQLRKADATKFERTLYNTVNQQ